MLCSVPTLLYSLPMLILVLSSAFELNKCQDSVRAPCYCLWALCSCPLLITLLSSSPARWSGFSAAFCSTLSTAHCSFACSQSCSGSSSARFEARSSALFPALFLAPVICSVCVLSTLLIFLLCALIWLLRCSLICHVCCSLLFCVLSALLCFLPCALILLLCCYLLCLCLLLVDLLRALNAALDPPLRVFKPCPHPSALLCFVLLSGVHLCSGLYI